MEKRRKFWLVLTTIMFVIFLIALWIFLPRYEGQDLWLLVPFLIIVYIALMVRAYFESDYIDLWKSWLKKKK